jgi:DNA-binding response OmpR family regulator
MKIAVLDDNPDMGEMLKQGLELAGHTVVVYSSPAKFLANFNAMPDQSSCNDAQQADVTSSSDQNWSRTPFDLIMVDLYLSEGFSGVQVIQQVWNTFPNLPAILISASTSWDIEAARKALPGVAILRKPFTMAALWAIAKEIKM